MRGATGLTTGAGDPSATVNMVRKRPTAKWQAKTGISGASHDNYYSYVDVGGPLAFDGKLRGRSVLAYRDSRSFRDNYGLQRAVGYGILEADLSDDTVLAVGFDYQDKQVQGTSWGTVPYWNSQGGKARLPRSTNMAAHWSSWPLTDKTTFATLDHRLGGGLALEGRLHPSPKRHRWQGVLRRRRLPQPRPQRHDGLGQPYARHLAHGGHRPQPGR